MTIAVDVESDDALWKNRVPLQRDVEKEKLLAELSWVENLFREKLPVGSNCEQIYEYFNYLHEVIYTTGTATKDEFNTSESSSDADQCVKVDSTGHVERSSCVDVNVGQNVDSS